MTRTAMLLAVAVASGCVHSDRVALATSMLGLACDWGQTRHAAGTGWAAHSERNPIMGVEPSVRTVDAYFAGVAVVNAAVWILTPERWRSAIPVAVTAAETRAIVRNVGTAGTVCGL